MTPPNFGVSIPATTTGVDASAATWDALVVGAGPAGAFAAIGLARAGLTTLLVDRKAFPRNKVCGGCLNGHAVALLDKAGLADEISALGARPLSSIRLRHGNRSAKLELPSGLAVTRATLDAVLVRAAISAGCAFLPETSALVENEGVDRGVPRDGTRRVALQQRKDEIVTARARVVVVADGLGHSSLRDSPSIRAIVEPDARVGVGAIADAGCVDAPAGRITMAVGRGGYVGITAVEAPLVNIAAALDVDFLKAQGGPANAVRAILSSADIAASSALDALDWLGTVPLTRRTLTPAAHRIFVLGDAAGYVEPFTGEGMAWALSAADALVPLAVRAIARWDDSVEPQWLTTYDTIVTQNQRWCRILARTLRHPSLVGIMVAALSHQPVLARPFLSRVAPGEADHLFGDSR